MYYKYNRRQQEEREMKLLVCLWPLWPHFFPKRVKTNIQIIAQDYLVTLFEHKVDTFYSFTIEDLLIEK